MSTIQDLIAQAEVEQESAENRRLKALSEIKLINAQAQQDGRSNLTPEEGARVNELFQVNEKIKDEKSGIAERLVALGKVAEEEREAERAAREVHTTNVAKPATDRSIRVGSEERTYHPGVDRVGTVFLNDVVRSFLFGDVQSQERIARHMQEERVERSQYLTRAVGTAAFAGLTVPQYLTDLYAPPARALRPFADICNQHVLPAEGMTVNISKITTALSTALQTAENTAVSETNMDDTLLTVDVLTAAGQQTVSRQAIERGTGIDDVVMADLFRSVSTTLDSTLINQASTGLTNVATTVSYADTNPTVAELYPKILEALAGAEASFLAMARPDFAVMHSRRWYWLSNALVTTHPFINQPMIPPAAHAAGTNAGVIYNSGVRGILPNGTLVCVDNNVSTTTSTDQDEIYIVASDECHLWEDPAAPVFIRAEQTAAATLGVLLVAYSYFAFTHNRYTSSHRKIAGTGLTTPTFTGS